MSELSAIVIADMIKKLVPKSLWQNRGDHRRIVKIVRLDGTLVIYRIVKRAPKALNGNYRDKVGERKIVTGDGFIRNYRPYR